MCPWAQNPWTDDPYKSQSETWGLVLVVPMSWVKSNNSAAYHPPTRRSMEENPQCLVNGQGQLWLLQLRSTVVVHPIRGPTTRRTRDESWLVTRLMQPRWNLPGSIAALFLPFWILGSSSFVTPKFCPHNCGPPYLSLVSGPTVLTTTGRKTSEVHLNSWPLLAAGLVLILCHLHLLPDHQGLARVQRLGGVATVSGCPTHPAAGTRGRMYITTSRGCSQGRGRPSSKGGENPLAPSSSFQTHQSNEMCSLLKISLE